MKSTVQKRLWKTAAVVVALAVVLSTLGAVGTVAAQEVTVSQSTTSTTTAPGATVTLQTTISVTDANAPGLQIQLPSGWTGSITDADGGFPNAEDGGNLLQVLWLESGTYTVTYEIDVPDTAATGDYTVDVEASAINPDTDEQIVETTQTTITVEEPQQNTPPTADAGGDQTVNEGTSVSLDGSGSADPDGDALSYSWTQTAGTPVGLSDASSAAPSFTAPSVDADETLTFELAVSDGNGGTDTDAVSVTVQNVADPNQAPTADAGSDQTVDEGVSVNLDGSGSSDPDGDALSYSWTQTSGPTVALSDASSATPSFTAPEVADDTTLTFELAVSDGNGGTDTDAVSVTVTDTDVDQPPAGEVDVSLEPADQSAVPGDEVTFDVVVSGTDDVGSFEGTITLSSTDGATIVGATTPATDSTEDVTVTGNSVSVAVFNLPAGTSDPVTVATVTVSADDVGSTDLVLSDVYASDQQGQSHAIGDTSDATLTVSVPPVVGDSPPTNVDDDPVFEDVNGDGAFNVGDAQALFANRNSEVVQNNVQYFDANGDGAVNVGDAQALFAEATA